MDEKKAGALTVGVRKVLTENDCSTDDCMAVGAELYLQGLRMAQPDLCIFIDMVVDGLGIETHKVLTRFVAGGVANMRKEVPMVHMHIDEDGKGTVVQDTLTDRPQGNRAQRRRKNKLQA
jgi:hypothetical protein